MIRGEEKPAMRFVHITDTHIAADPAYASFGQTPFANLAAIVDAINSLAFPVDFVLHTGDVVEDGSEAAYGAAREVLARLRLPIHFVAGNHDNGDLLQKVLLDRPTASARLDYQFTVDSVVVAVFDSRGPKDPAGTLRDEQMAALRALCMPKGPPLVIAIHHPPFPLDSTWLNDGWSTATGHTPNMLLDRGPEFLDAIAPARDRLRGVFFGHVHRSFQIMNRGILFSSAPSSFGQFLTWPGQAHPEGSPAEPAGFSLVTITDGRTIVRQHALPRPDAVGDT
jgi:Icc protein